VSKFQWDGNFYATLKSWLRWVIFSHEKLQILTWIWWEKCDIEIEIGFHAGYPEKHIKSVEMQWNSKLHALLNHCRCYKMPKIARKCENLHKIELKLKYNQNFDHQRQIWSWNRIEISILSNQLLIELGTKFFKKKKKFLDLLPKCLT
jgi:hypothetical protein